MAAAELSQDGGTRARPYYSVSQAAAFLGVSRVSIWRWISSGQLAASRLGHRTTRIKHDDLQAFMAQPQPGSRSWMTQSLNHRADRTVDPVDGRPPFADAGAIPEAEHLVQFYKADEFLLDAVANFIGTALAAGDAGIVVATPAHRRGVDKRLRDRGIDVGDALASGQYTLLDATEALSRFMADGVPDAGRFLEVFGGLIARASHERSQVRVFGEMVAILAGEGNELATVRLEELWNDLQRTQRFSLLCAYPIGPFAHEELDGLLPDVCAQHSQVIPTEHFLRLATDDERMRAIVELEQKARRLEGEITERRQAEEALRRREKELRELLETREEFLSAAAHDLINPLTGIKAHAELLKLRAEKGSIPALPQLLHGLGAIDAGTRKMTALINDLLDIGQLQLGQPLELNRCRIDLVDLARRVVAEYQQSTERHQIRVEGATELSGGWDAERLERVLGNLLSNAIKYSPNGGDILVSATRDSVASDRWAVLAVRDNGIGIPHEDLPRVFDRFSRGANAVGRIRGTGIGLTSVRRIVEAHGGTISVESDEGAGCTFTIRLPLAAEVPVEAQSRS